MHHQARVCMCCGLAGLQDKRNALARGGVVLAAPAVDGQTCDVLHHHVGLAVGQQPAIDHAGDAGVFQHGQDAALGQEAVSIVGVCQHDALECGALFVLAVGAFHLVDFAHAAAAQRAYHAPSAGKIAGLQCRRHCRGDLWAFQPACAGIDGGEQAFDFTSDGSRCGAVTQPRSALRCGHVQDLVEQGFDLLPVRDTGHVLAVLEAKKSV